MKKSIHVNNSEVFIEGSGTRTIVMLHGWPDTHTLWRKQIDHLSQDYVCVTFTMPGFARNDLSDYSAEAIVARIHEVVDAVSPDNKIILLVHDWGCVFGHEYAMRYSDRVERMISLDVGNITSRDFQKSLSVSEKLMIFTYQIILAVSFVCPRKVGDKIALFMAKTLKARSDRENIHAGMSMPYAMLWLGVNGGLKKLLPVKPSFPLYYAYGAKKPVMFQSSEWLQQLQEKHYNKVESFDCGHWIMVDRADELNASIADWLASD